MERVIITGAGGFLGCELTKKLVENGVHVVAVSLVFDDSFPESPLITRVTGEISDEKHLLSIIPKEKYLAFYHFAWLGVNGPMKADPIVQMNNARITMVCATVAKQLGCKRFLCAGTVAENVVASLPFLELTSGGMMYGVAKHCTHLMLDAYCKNVGLPLVWMQFSNIYGPNNKTGNLVSYTLEEILHDRIACFGPALQPYDFIYINDLIEIIYRLCFCETRYNNYIISSGQPRILKDYLLLIGELCKKSHLINIGVRPDDGVKYSIDMFDNTVLLQDIGPYQFKPFEDGIAETIRSLRDINDSEI